MNTIRCYEPACDGEAELLCNCTSPVTYSCENHMLKHYKSSSPHNFSSIFVEPVEGTKEAILQFLAEEKSKIEKIKANIIESFAQTLRLLSRRKKALECLQEAIRIDPNDADAHNWIGVILGNENKCEEAVKYHNKAIRINPNCSLYYNDKGYALYRLGRIEKAIDYLEKAIRIDPNNANSINNIGNILTNEKRYEEGVKQFSEAIRINPNSANYYYNKGYALKELGRREEAMESYKEAIRIDPNYPVSYSCKEFISENEKRQLKCTLF
ncbi:unnamed protein product [Blepharisma stoltei]|uniref:Tetratricopeptide repeat protein n=1 Tax=Blepharisma stoltei TaxID=1481888 RepID=A0AAU9JN06_9CILI|nr:unnamed protein product [Blepharisma stoltei]